MPSTRSDWHDLPEKVLVRLFEYGTSGALKDAGLPFALLVSQVCKKWRSTAARTPSVWCTIPVQPSRNGLLEHFLERAGAALPLDLCFHLNDRDAIEGNVVSLALSQAHCSSGT